MLRLGALFAKEFWVFGLKEARACVFAGSFFALLFLSKHVAIPGLARYDFLFLAALLLQVVLVALKIETRDEVKVIFLFHLLGFTLEVFKTQPGIGSWSYPEPGYLKLFGVPLYSGFMYSAVGSYVNYAWKIFNIRLTHAPPPFLFLLLSVLAYVNFFTHHFIPDFRWWISAMILIAFWRTMACFTVIEKERKMPLVVSFVLIGFFIWVAENISTYFGAWQYPDQTARWSVVHIGKISSWALLVIISVNIIAWMKQREATHTVATPATLPQATSAETASLTG